jgi:biopolymer transport protein ExbD
MKKILFGLGVAILIAVLFMISNVDAPKGKWYNQGSIYNLPIKSIEFQDSSTIVVDDHGIVSQYTSHSQNGELILSTVFDTSTFDLRVYKDSIFINETLFIKEDLRKDVFEIDLLDIEGSDVVHNFNPSNTYYIGIKKVKETVQYQLNQKICTIDKLPIFLARRYSEYSDKSKSALVFLFLDESISYQELTDFYVKLYMGDVKKVTLVTSKSSFEKYTGIHHYIDFWKEDFDAYQAAKYKNKYGIPPPLPPVEVFDTSKKSFFEMNEEVKIIDKMDVSMLKIFEDYYMEGKEDLLVNIKPDISIRDYLIMRHKINEHVKSVKDKVAKEKFNVVYDEVTMEQRREMWNYIPRLTLKTILN